EATKIGGTRRLPASSLPIERGFSEQEAATRSFGTGTEAGCPKWFSGERVAHKCIDRVRLFSLFLCVCVRV
uniref:Uncharacterized protein n=1 Tax=Anopheles arabiensis TaxID=7173 RepID=A0A182IHN3_ANOAR